MTAPIIAVTVLSLVGTALVAKLGTDYALIGQGLHPALCVAAAFLFGALVPSIVVILKEGK
jgi:hypothetical protein